MPSHGQNGIKISLQMRIYYTIALLGFLISCGSSKVEQEVVLNETARKDSNTIANSSVEANGDSEQTKRIPNGSATITQNDFSSKEKVAEIMKFLASDELQGREAGSEGIAKAADFIATNFEKNGIAPYFSSYRDTLVNFDQPAFNVVGFVEGNDPLLKQQFIIIGAHYDHIGILEEENGDSVANGANDNASGTTTVLELARYFGAARNNRRSIIFALFSAEEKGLIGSKHLARKLKEQELNLYAMLNFEMVGVPLSGRNYEMYVTGYQNSNLAEICNRYAKEKLVGFLPSAADMNLFQRSDNYPFFTEFTVPAQTFCTFDFTNFNHYHKVGDENALMDFDHMASIINKSIPVIQGIANSPIREIIWHR